MKTPLHHLVRQLRDEGWSWHQIAVAFPALGLDPATDLDGVAMSARRGATRRRIPEPAGRFSG